MRQIQMHRSWVELFDLSVAVNNRRGAAALEKQPKPLETGACSDERHMMDAYAPELFRIVNNPEKLVLRIPMLLDHFAKHGSSVIAHRRGTFQNNIFLSGYCVQPDADDVFDESVHRFQTFLTMPPTSCFSYAFIDSSHTETQYTAA